MPITVTELKRGLVVHDNGVLKRGAHSSDSREYCALEFSSVQRGKPFSDTPGDLPDLRPLNDAFGEDDEARTECLLPVLAAYWDWAEWSESRKQATMIRVAIYTVNRIITLLHVPPAHQKACVEAKTLAEAERAAAAAAEASAEAAAAGAARVAGAASAEAAVAAEASAEAAALAAALAAGAAAGAARVAAHNNVLATACQLWIDAADETEGL